MEHERIYIGKTENGEEVTVNTNNIVFTSFKKDQKILEQISTGAMIFIKDGVEMPVDDDSRISSVNVLLLGVNTGASEPTSIIISGEDATLIQAILINNFTYVPALSEDHAVVIVGSEESNVIGVPRS